MSAGSDREAKLYETYLRAFAAAQETHAGFVLHDPESLAATGLGIADAMAGKEPKSRSSLVGAVREVMQEAGGGG